MSQENTNRSSGGNASSLHTVTLINLLAEQFSQLLTAINQSNASLETKFVQFKEEIKKSQEEATERMVRKAKREKPYSFTKKGNQAQFEFNEKVVEVLEDAESIVEKVEESVQSHHPIQDNTLEKLKDSLKKGQSLLAERQKLIKLADWSRLWVGCGGRVPVGRTSER